jgi:hypothetical protein
MSYHFRVGAILAAVAAFIAFPLSAQTPCEWQNASTGVSVTTDCGKVGVGTTAPSANWAASSVITVVSAPSATGRGVLELGTDRDAGNHYAGVLSFFNTAAASGRSESSAIYVQANASGTALDRGYSMQFLTKGDGVALAERMRIDSNGNIGVATATPNVLGWGGNSPVMTILSSAGSLGRGTLEIGTDRDAGSQFAGVLAMFNHSANSGRRESGSIYVQADASGTANDRGYSMQFLTKSNAGPLAERLRIDSSGNVGIGVHAPTVKLDVAGDARFTGTVTGGNIQAKFQDIAEWVPANADLALGTVVVLNRERENEVQESERSYDSAVAGVVSEEPGLLLGESGAGKERIATMGRVLVRVDARQRPIAVGDLLVTSNVPGVAMRSEPVKAGDVYMHRPGTIIGKALQPLREGQGAILVLLSLQ